MSRRAVFMFGALVFLGCTSPEIQRTRGGDAGADKGNRGEVVRMHEGSKPYYKTPRLIEAKHPSLETAEDARQRASR